MGSNQSKCINPYTKETMPNFKYEKTLNNNTFLYKHIFTDELFASSRYPFDEPINSSGEHILYKELFYWKDIVDIYGRDPIPYRHPPS